MSSSPLTDAELSALREQRTHEGRCPGCGVDQGATHLAGCTRAVWMTAVAAKEHFGVDPTGHDQPGHAQPVRSKLSRSMGRLWFMEDVEALARAWRDTPPVDAQEAQLTREIGARLEASARKRNDDLADWRRRHG